MASEELRPSTCIDAASRQAPRSAVSQSSALISLMSFLVMSFAILSYGIRNEVTALVILLLAIAIPSLILSGNEERRTREARKAGASLSRSLVKTVGLSCILVGMYLIYSLFPEYETERYRQVMEHSRSILLLALLVSPIYVFLTDARMSDPHDGLYMVGRICTFRPDADHELAKKYLMGWAVKLFFLPLMLGFALEDLRWFVGLDAAAALEVPRGWFEASYRYLFVVDVVWASVGYLCTLRLFNAHIRSTEPTLWGWLVCIVCYPPFWGLFYERYLRYDDDYYWGHYFAIDGYGGVLWGGVILVLVAVYVWATVSFGIRFSNLTNRGIITSGPYRFTKHPAYISKNISWWMISVPFIAQSGLLESVSMCVMLLLLNGIYYMRARTEEAHLSSDPAYVEYAEWISHNGLLPRIGRAARRLTSA